MRPDIISFAKSVLVHRNRRRFGIKVLFVIRKRLRAFQMHQITQNIRRIAGTAVRNRILLSKRQCVAFFDPDAEQFSEPAWITAAVHQIILVYNPAEIRRHKGAALPDIIFQLFFIAALYHI